jgi:hypothetical protein
LLIAPFFRRLREKSSAVLIPARLLPHVGDEAGQEMLLQFAAYAHILGKDHLVIFTVGQVFLFEPQGIAICLINSVKLRAMARRA